MRTLLGNLLVGVMITSVGMFGADSNNFIGTWKLNVEKSKFDPGPMPKSLTMTIEASDGGVKNSSTGEQGDGTPINSSYTAKYDGKDYPVTGDTTIAMKEVNANTHTYTQKRGGKVSGTGRGVISNGGKTMTLTLTGTNAEGKKFHNVTVYDKQ